jgi:hypothetical protein
MTKRFIFLAAVITSLVLRALAASNRNPELGTSSVQLRERKSGVLVPKRHQNEALGFLTLIVRDQGVGGSNPLSPTNLLFWPPNSS